jgi:hypothetical protein
VNFCLRHKEDQSPSSSMRTSVPGAATKMVLKTSVESWVRVSFYHLVEMKKQYSWARDDGRYIKSGLRRWFGVDITNNLEHSVQY